MPSTVYEQRTRAAWRTRACAAGIATGAMIFSVGAGIAVPISLNAAQWAAPPALALSALIAWQAQRAQRRGAASRESILSRALWIALGATLALCAAFLACAQISLAERTLLPQARIYWIAMIVVVSAAVCARCGMEPVCRLCFATRYILPALLGTLGAKALQKGSPFGLFPLLGSGAGPLLLSAVCMLCAAAPALLLFAPAGGECGGPELTPPARFFVLRVLAGGVAGTLLLFSLTLCNTYHSLLSQDVWGERMLVTCTHEPRIGIPQMALILTQMLGLGLATAALLCGAGRCTLRAVKRLWGPRASLAAGVIPMAIAVYAMVSYGLDRTLYAAPLLAVPEIIILLLSSFLKPREAI